MQQNTGVMLSEAKGPLNNLMDNLSGEHSDYWLKALRKLLRQEEIPEPPPEVLKTLKSFNQRGMAKKKMDDLVNYLNTIPAVHRARLCDDDTRNIMDIEVYANFASFLHGNKDSNEDQALFTLTQDRQVAIIGGVDHRIYDKTFDSFNAGRFSDLQAFVKALIWLGKEYVKNSPSI
jgi:hypothetical protein